LSNQSQNSDGEFVGIWAIAADKIHTAILKAQEEFSIPRESVQFRNYETRFVAFTEFQCCGQLRSFLVSLSARFDF
jgi:hypothetical protein